MSLQHLCVAVSGGVDSLCALLLASRGRHKVTALHGRFLDGGDRELELLDRACRRLGVNLHVPDLRASFQEEVVDPFLADLLAGKTPNPCCVCNRQMKFGALLRASRELGADALATGHYACVRPGYGADRLLARGRDPRKDQSYFLALLSPGQVRSARFPLSGLDKEACRRLVAEAGLEIPAPRESQDICFLKKGGLRSFLQARAKAAAPGPIYLVGDGAPKLVGEHRGLCHYTIGQRRGLNIAHSEPLYVLARDSGRNALLVCSRRGLGIASCRAEAPVFHVPPELWPGEVFAQLRSSQKAARARVRADAKALEISFASPQFPSAPGQIAAVYDGEGILLAGGVLA